MLDSFEANSLALARLASIDRAVIAIERTVKATVAPLVLIDAEGKETRLPSYWQSSLPKLFDFLLGICKASDKTNA